MEACTRRRKKTEAHHRWESVSSTMGLPCGVIVDGTEQEALFRDCNDLDVPISSSSAATATSAPKRYSSGGDESKDDGAERAEQKKNDAPRPSPIDRTGGGEASNHGDTGKGSHATSRVWENGAGDAEDADLQGYPEIPTEDLGVFMATLLDGMRSDGVQLAQSAKTVVASTYQVRVGAVLLSAFLMLPRCLHARTLCVLRDPGCYVSLLQRAAACCAFGPATALSAMRPFGAHCTHTQSPTGTAECVRTSGQTVYTACQP